MCIIVYKPIGAKLPNVTTLDNCLDNNPDGAGFMFNIAQGVLIHKGFKTGKALLKALNKDLQKYGCKEENVYIAIHARIATAGLVKAENCHPFPITNHIGDIQSTYIIADRAMVHNGMISIDDEGFKNLSDTQIFVRDILSVVDLKSRAIKKLIGLSIGSSKMLVFDKNGMANTFGAWVKDGDLYYSNTTYKAVSYSRYSYGWEAWKSYDDYTNVPDFGADSVDECVYCGAYIVGTNQAYLRQHERLGLGLTAKENLCRDCFDIVKKDLSI